MNDLEFKVLFIDDDLNMQETVVSCLLENKVRVTSAFDGATGIALAKENKFDLILQDLGLPDMDGFDILKQLKEHPDISPAPVILLTGRSSTAEKVQAFRQGAVDYITKPFDINGNGAVIDGSRIVTTRSGARAVAGSTVDGFEFLAGSGAAVKNDVLQGGGTLSNVTLAGFGSGAAVKLNNAAGIAIDRVTLGLDGNGNRLANQFGVLATGAGTSSGAGACTTASSGAAAALAAALAEGSASSVALSAAVRPSVPPEASAGSML